MVEKIARLCGLRTVALDEFIKKYNIDVEELFKYINKGLTQKMMLISAISGTPNNTKLKHLLSILQNTIVENIKTDGKYLLFDDGSLTSIPEEDDHSFIMMRNADGDFFINKRRKDIYLQGNKYDKIFHSIKDLVKFINKEKMVYIGID